MFRSIADNAGTIIVGLALIALVVWIVVRLRRDRRQGKSSCGCGCGSCPMAGSCHKQG